MKKFLSSILLLALLISVASAQVYIGSRQAGMGGTGVASAVGLNAVAYNPAGIMKGKTAEFLVSFGTASHGLDQLTSALSTASDPSGILADNVATAYDVNGSLSGLLGLSVRKIGVSIIVPSVAGIITKPAGSIAGQANLGARYDIAVTAGHTFTLPAFPIGSLDVGANLKSINYAYGQVTAAGALPITAYQYWGQGSGLGFDLGARTTIEIPAFSSFSAGIALKDIGSSVNIAEPKRRQDTYTITNTLIEGAEETDTTKYPAGNYSPPSALVIGCAGSIPVVGLKLAADIESISGGTGPLAVASDTVTHLGFEYPLFMDALALRLGFAAGQYVSLTTMGAKISAPFVALEFATIFDSKNSKNNSFIIDAGIAF